VGPKEIANLEAAKFTAETFTKFVIHLDYKVSTDRQPKTFVIKLIVIRPLVHNSHRLKRRPFLIQINVS